MDAAQTRSETMELKSNCFSEYEAPDGTIYQAFKTTAGGIYVDVDNSWDKEFDTEAEWDVYRAENSLEWVGCDERDY
jgi:hypothetical protein